MELNESQIRYMIEGTTKDLALFLMNDYKMDMIDALSTVYESDTYSKLADTTTGLYSQSSIYVYDYLLNEIKNGKMA